MDIQDKLKSYDNYLTKAKDYFEKNFDNIKELFENQKLRDFIFEPFADVFKNPPKTIDKDIYFIITQVAIINAVLAGLPGKMGIGIWVSIALEAYMAYSIAKHVGIKLDKPSDIFKYFGLIGATAATILWGFKVLLSFGFSLFSVIPELNPLIIAELAVTNFVGVLFWIGFSEAKEKGSFIIPKRMLLKVLKFSKELFTYQFITLKNVLTPSNLKLFGRRIKQWLTGDFVVDKKVINGELFTTAAMVYLIQGKNEKLEGPLGDIFLDAIRLRWSAQLGPDATVEEIAQRFSQYDEDALVGAVNTIKGKMFELIVEKYENQDNDSWTAELFTDESHPDSDITFTNYETGQIIEVSLKATDNKNIIEYVLERYPDTVIMTTDEIAAVYGDDMRVIGSGISHDTLQNITEENVEDLISTIEPISNSTQVVVGGVAMGALAAIWPFTIAYARKKISYDEYESALKHILPDSGVSLASRVSYLLLLGPIFAWYLLARGVGKLVDGANQINNEAILLRQE